jgi:chaperone modulatory protein CbpM
MMITSEQLLDLLQGQLDRATLETYVAHAWVRPVASDGSLRFEEIDIARIRLVRHLQADVLINDDGMEVVLHLLDQLYELRRRLTVHETGGEITTVEFREIG